MMYGLAKHSEATVDKPEHLQPLDLEDLISAFDFINSLPGDHQPISYFDGNRKIQLDDLRIKTAMDGAVGKTEELSEVSLDALESAQELPPAVVEDVLAIAAIDAVQHVEEVEAFRVVIEQRLGEVKPGGGRHTADLLLLARIRSGDSKDPDQAAWARQHGISPAALSEALDAEMNVFRRRHRSDTET